MRLFVWQHATDYHRSMFSNLLIGAVVAALVVTQSMAGVKADLVREVEQSLPNHLGACVLAINQGEVVFEHAYGLADIETKSPCTPATNFRMASVSKQFTATAVMLLVDRGKLALSDPLTKFFPNFPNYGRKITVKH